MELEYIKTGDYYNPTLMANKEPEEALTKYGLMRKEFLKEHRRGIYTGMMLEGTLKEHCLTIQQQAEELMDVLIKQMSREQGVDEKLKALDQMKWVRMLNIIRASAEEMVCNEIIYI